MPVRYNTSSAISITKPEFEYHAWYPKKFYNRNTIWCKILYQSINANKMMHDWCPVRYDTSSAISVTKPEFEYHAWYPKQFYTRNTIWCKILYQSMPCQQNDAWLMPVQCDIIRVVQCRFCNLIIIFIWISSCIWYSNKKYHQFQTTCRILFPVRCRSTLPRTFN